MKDPGFGRGELTEPPPEPKEPRPDRNRGRDRRLGLQADPARKMRKPFSVDLDATDYRLLHRDSIRRKVSMRKIIVELMEPYLAKLRAEADNVEEGG